MWNNIITGGDISMERCPTCEELMIYEEYKHDSIHDEYELSLRCENCTCIDCGDTLKEGVNLCLECYNKQKKDITNKGKINE